MNKLILKSIVADVVVGAAVAADGTIPDEAVAAMAYDANRRFSALNGEFTLPAWADAKESTRAAMTGAVDWVVANPDATPADQHARWMQSRIDDGWKYGPVVDLENKIHPNLVPFEELPENQRVKDVLFRAVVANFYPKVKSGIDDLFAGEADGRQTEQGTLTAGQSLFRRRYRALSGEELALHDSIKDKASELADLLFKVSPVNEQADANKDRGLNVTLAVRHLEDCVCRAVKGLTA